MKKYVIVLFLVLLAIAFFFSFKKNSLTVEEKITTSISQNPLSTPATKQNQAAEDSDYKTSWIIVRNPEKIELSSNISQKSPASELYTKNNCQHLVSGGFYSNESGHIGLFIEDKNVISRSIENSTFNGYFFISDQNRAEISSVSPPDPVRVAIQAGPLLYSDGKPRVLSLTNDEPARRIVIATTGEGAVVFLVYYRKDAPLLGPNLRELPELLEEIDQKTNLNFVDAINIDGGNHSSFITDSLKLSETAFIGSYFCIKP